MLQTVTTKDIQRNYRKVFDLAKKTKQPVIVICNSKPDIAIIDLDKLEELEALNKVLHSWTEGRAGKTKILKSLVDLWHEAQKTKRN